MASSPTQRRIGTHSGSFHCDEALACWMLKQLPEYADAEIVRSRDPAVLATVDLCVDVGGVYDPTQHRYDHHQRGFAETLDEEHKIKLSSAGLVFKHFGRAVIQTLLRTDAEQTEKLFMKMYNGFVEEVDAIDNGVSLVPEGIEAPYHIGSHVSARVASLNPAWNDPHPDPESGFRKAMQITGEEFMRHLHFYGRVWLPAYEHVLHALQNRHQFGETGEIMLLEQFCPWTDHFFTLEQQLGVTTPVKYVIFEDTSGSWRVRAVPQTSGAFENRKPLPEPWRGLRESDLDALTGVPGGIFVHASGFIGGHRTRDGALELARRALAFEDAGAPSKVAKLGE